MVLSLVSLSNESCLLLPRNVICWQEFPPSYWRLLCLLLRSGTEEHVSAGTQSLLPGASGLGFTRCLRTSRDQNFYGQLCTEKSLRVWQEAVFLMGGWKNHTEKVANYPTVKLKGSFFLIVTETLPLSGTEHWLWQKKKLNVFVLSVIKALPFLGCVLYLLHLSNQQQHCRMQSSLSG